MKNMFSAKFYLSNERNAQAADKIMEINIQQKKSELQQHEIK